MDTRLDGRIALITGGAGVIGSAIAEAFVREGCRVYLGDSRIEAALDRAEALGPCAHALALDVRRAHQCTEAARRITEEAGGIDILVNNAGVITAGPVAEASIGNWDEVCAVNLSGAVYCCKAVLPAMVAKRRGRIINIASISAEKGGGLVGNVLYGTTKAGIVALTKGLARELAPHGITVNAIGPSVVDTPMTQPYLTPEVRERLATTIPMGRFGTPQDVAAVALFLASDASSYVTGETLYVDGGMLKR